MKELYEKFKNFKKNYIFVQNEVYSDDDGNLLVNGEIIKPKDKKYGNESEHYIDVAFNSSKPLSKLLSNLYPYNFKVNNLSFGSIEGFFQGIKFKDITLQNEVFKMSGLEACAIKGASEQNWQDSGVVYFQGMPIKRDSDIYENLVDLIYVCALTNPFYRQALKNCKKTILHLMGKDNSNETVFTRYEFEKQLNCLKDFVNFISTDKIEFD